MTTSRTTPLARGRRTLLLAGIAAVLLSAVLAAGAPKQAAAAPVMCPTFKVLHNDRIGKMNLPKGYYSVTVLDGNRLTCAQASKLFAQFLQDYDGVLPAPWVAYPSSRTFRRGPGSATGFRVAPNGMPNGGGGGPVYPSRGTACGGYFRVLHNDRIGALSLPKGQYRITAAGLSCAAASQQFAQFLQDYDGVLPRPWKLNVATATFTKSSSVWFRVERAYGPAPKPDPTPNPIPGQVACAGTFSVLHNDRIGPVAFPKGKYQIFLLQKTGLTCAQASARFTEFLNYPSGRLPAPWRLAGDKGAFRQGAGGIGFRVKQVS